MGKRKRNERELNVVPVDGFGGRQPTVHVSLEIRGMRVASHKRKGTLVSREADAVMSSGDAPLLYVPAHRSVAGLLDINAFCMQF